MWKQRESRGPPQLKEDRLLLRPSSRVPCGTLARPACPSFPAPYLTQHAAELPHSLPPISPNMPPSFLIWKTTESTIGALPSTLTTLAASRASCSEAKRA